MGGNVRSWKPAPILALVEHSGQSCSERQYLRANSPYIRR